MGTIEQANTGFSHKPSSCQPGCIRLQQFLIATFGATNSGCYSVNSVLTSGRPSWHQYGKAIDMGANWNDPAGRARGDRVFDWVLLHANELNLQQMIWGNRIWDVSYGGVRAYHRDDHFNHVHIAIGYAASQNWQSGAPGPAPPPSPPKGWLDMLTDEQQAQLYNWVWELHNVMFGVPNPAPRDHSLLQDIATVTGQIDHGKPTDNGGLQAQVKNALGK